jgi:hypothetical protein
MRQGMRVKVKILSPISMVSEPSIGSLMLVYESKLLFCAYLI